MKRSVLAAWILATMVPSSMALASDATTPASGNDMTVIKKKEGTKAVKKMNVAAKKKKKKAEEKTGDNG